MGKKLTTDEFIDKAIRIHDDKYDYSKAEYINTKTKICIICPIHGEFWQVPSSHMNGFGCVKCAKHLITNEYFIERAKEIHGDVYDYSNVVYIKNNKKVHIICQQHGEFLQTPASHLGGQACPKCGIIKSTNKRKSTIDDFIKKAKEIHNDFYNYSESIYTGRHSKIKILCPKCGGSFEQLVGDHLKGAGCPICRHRRNTQEWFLENSINKYGNLYNYSKTKYVDSRSKLIIICSTHGEFEIRSEQFLKGKGCPKCSCHGHQFTKEEEINKFISVHGNKYDYSKVDFVNVKTKICIICSEHGEFYQTPSVHLKGSGCPKCIGLYRTTETFIEAAKLIHGELYDYSNTIYDGCATKICIKCKEHGEFYQRPISHLIGHGCQKCAYKTYKSELKIINRIQNEFGGASITPQYKSKWLERLSIDVMLNMYNIGIEYQGIQHFQSVKHFGGNKVFTGIQERDIRKHELCLKNGVDLLYFTYLKNIDFTDYLYDVYTNEEDLIDKIKEIIKLKENAKNN